MDEWIFGQNGLQYPKKGERQPVKIKLPFAKSKRELEPN
jgi:hypothetical protein